MAEQIKDAGRLNSPSAIQPTEDAEMRSAMCVIQACGNWESII
jgi:hypothetical protein